MSSVYLNYGFLRHISMSQRFCNILVTRDTIQQLWMILLRFWRWWTTLDCQMLSSPDILCMSLTGFASVAWSTAMESMILSIPDFIEIFAIQTKFFEPSVFCIVINYIFFTTNVFCLLPWRYGLFSTCKA